MSGSIAIRALLALLLMVGFYVLALGIVAALGYFAYEDLTGSDSIHLRLLLFAAVGIFGILYGIVPRIDNFTAPGPILSPRACPRLHAVLDNIAQETRQEMPSEVYLVADVNAWVAQRGGFMGFGSRRVMGLGLPLLQTLTVRQLQGIVAHEFGHYHGGDTMLGPWVYKTRSAVVRTVRSLEHGHLLLQLPFYLYAKMFLHISQAVSRRQEFNADRLAVEIVGKEDFASGLATVAAVAPAFAAYWESEVQPLLSQGLHASIAGGFSQFLTAPGVRPQVDAHLRRELHEGRTQSLDSHPSLSDRLRAIEAPHPDQLCIDPKPTPPAIDLLDQVPELERRLLGVLVSPAFAEQLESIPWSDAVRAYVPMWRNMVAQNASGLRDQRVVDLPQCLTRTGESLTTLGAALALALFDAGWSFRTNPGEPVLACHGEHGMDPFATVRALHSGKKTAESWKTESERLGIAALALFHPGLDATSHQMQERELPWARGEPAAEASPLVEAAGRDADAEEPDPGDLVDLAPCGTRAEAEQIQIALADAGIGSIVRGDDGGGIIPLSNLCTVRVRYEDLERAAAILAGQDEDNGPVA